MSLFVFHAEANAFAQLQSRVSSIATGDLIFVRPKSDPTLALDDAILATGEATVHWMRQNGVPQATWEISSHVALAIRNDSDGTLSFVQAIPPYVMHTSEKDFWHSVPPGATLYHGVIQNPAVAAGAPAAAAASLAQVGKPYASDFGPPPNEFYCSSLVEWAYQQALNTTGASVLCPADFKLIFVPEAWWERYYASLGMDLPTNTTGSNPTLLLHSPKVAFEKFDVPMRSPAPPAAIPF